MHRWLPKVRHKATIGIVEESVVLISVKRRTKIAESSARVHLMSL